jgi:predicted nucleic acid-binding protein
VSPRPYVLDTNVFIRRGLEPLAERYLLSSVVLQELAAGARDAAEIRLFGAMRAAAEADGTLLTPNGEDWFQTGKVLNALHRGLRSHRQGPTPAIPKEEQQRLLRDVLIARSAKRVNATVVTHNKRDFAKIRRFCNVPVAEPDEVL